MAVKKAPPVCRVSALGAACTNPPTVMVVGLSSAPAGVMACSEHAHVLRKLWGTAVAPLPKSKRK